MSSNPRGYALLIALLCLPVASEAQSTLLRSPNLPGGWSGERGTVYFHFLHRFDASPAPDRKVTNSPTFLLAHGVRPGVLLGFNYATSSDVVTRYPNEWEFFGRLRLLGASAPLMAAVQGGYNLAAESWDGALDVSHVLGPLRLLGTARGFSSAYGGDAAAALGGGAVLSAGPVALAGDVARVLDGSERTVWSAGLQLRIPYSPHTVSLQATTAGTGTLQGSTRGTGQVRYGFEFTIPITLARYFRRTAAPTPPAADTARPAVPAEASAAVASADTVTINIKNLAYERLSVVVAPGTRVRWINGDPVEHTVTAVDGTFDSGLIKPQGGVYERVFAQAGDFAYACTPHPFMQARIVVRAGGQ